MANAAGSGVSIGTWGWVVEAAGDIAAPGQGSFVFVSATAGTATFSVTPPEDGDYDHSACSVTKSGSASDSVATPFHTAGGAAECVLEGLAADTLYSAVLSGFDGSDEATANRGRPSPAVLFRTAAADVVTAAGSISLLLENLKTLLASCASWQAWTGAANAAAAGTFIRKAAVRPGALSDDDFPYGLIYFGDDGGETDEYELAWQDKGQLVIEFVDRVSAAYLDANGEPDVERAIPAYTNRTGAVLGDLRSGEGEGAYLVVSRIRYSDVDCTKDRIAKSRAAAYHLVQTFTLEVGP